MLAAWLLDKTFVFTFRISRQLYYDKNFKLTENKYFASVVTKMVTNWQSSQSVGGIRTDSTPKKGAIQMGEWKKSSCALCAQNCGLEIMVEDNLIIKVRGDKENLRSRGYCCRKGLNISHYQQNADRVLYPMKKVNDHHERITWEQAINEIAEKMLAIRAAHGSRAFAYMGGGGLGGQMQAGLGLRLLSALGSRYYYSSMMQEFSDRKSVV